MEVQPIRSGDEPGEQVHKEACAFLHEALLDRLPAQLRNVGSSELPAGFRAIPQ